MSSLTIVVSPDQALSIAVAFYLKDKGYNSFKILMPKSSVVTPFVNDILSEIGASIIFDDIYSLSLNGCKELYVHTFAYKESEIKYLLDNCHSNKVDIICYSDGLKNDYSVEFVRNSRPSRLLFFGWIYDKGIISDVNVDIFPLRRMIELYRSFALTDLKPLKTTSKKLAVLLRYWGIGPYSLKSDVSAQEAMFRVVASNMDKGFDELFIKSDRRVSKNVNDAFRAICIARLGIPVRDFSELIGSGVDINEYPLELVLTHPTGAAFDCFDSSVSIYLAALGESPILFPKHAIIREIFENKQGAAAAIYFSSLFDRVCNGIYKYRSDNVLIVPSKLDDPITVL